MYGEALVEGVMAVLVVNLPKVVEQRLRDVLPPSCARAALRTWAAWLAKVGVKGGTAEGGRVET